MDPDLRYTPSGAAVLGFRIAVDRYWRDKQSNESKKDTSFFQCNLWGQSAERLSKELRKGSAVLVEGSLRSRSWDKDGQKHYAVGINANRVSALEWSEEKAGEGPQRTQGTGEPERETDVPPRDQIDDIPF
jgi:single-strand DNA-binding protein